MRVKDSFALDMAQAVIEGLVFLSFAGLLTSTLIVFGAVVFSIWN
jgi:hypothetical protein